jgi:homoserine kinase type II
LHEKDCAYNLGFHWLLLFPLLFMAVFTEVSEQHARDLLTQLAIGDLVSLQGISSGIENTNYFLTTDQGEFVLTVFERLNHDQLPFYLYLMKHLAERGIEVPDPQSNRQGDILLTLVDKPAAVVNRLQGESQMQPGVSHCAAMGQTLAKMHLAAHDFDKQQPNLRGLAWWNDTVPQILPFLSADHETLSGVFDFYFAGVDRWLFDLGVCINDWCIDDTTGVMNTANLQAMLAAYQTVRPLSAAERALFNPMLRAAALRFWISRLWDFHLPREASMLQAHDPTHFERVLQQRLIHPVHL